MDRENSSDKEDKLPPPSSSNHEGEGCEEAQIEDETNQKINDVDWELLHQSNETKFQLIFKIFTLLSSIALGGSAFTNLYEVAFKPLLFISWGCFFLSIVVMSFNLIHAYHKGMDYAEALAITNNPHLPALDNTCAYYGNWASGICMVAGLFFLLLSVALGNHCQTEKRDVPHPESIYIHKKTNGEIEIRMDVPQQKQ